MKTNFFHILLAAVVCAALSSCARPGDKLVSQAMKAYAAMNYDDALALFEEALAVESRYPEELLYTFISNVYSKLEEWETSGDYLEKALAMRADYRGFVTLGMVRRESGQDDKAEVAFRTALSLDNNKADAFVHLGALYLAQDKAADALPLLETAATLAPKEALIYADLAVAHAMLGNTANSLDALTQATTLHYENADELHARVERLLAAPAR